MAKLATFTCKLLITSQFLISGTEIHVYPKDKFRDYRHHPLSKFQASESSTKKLFWSKSAITEIKNSNFKYTEKPEHFMYTISKEQVNNYTNFYYKDFDYLKQAELPPKIFGKKKPVLNYLSKLFRGPNYNFDIRRSTLSNNLRFEIFGLFTREFIPKNSVIGNYVGKIGFGADADYEKFVYSDKHFEYIYNGARDYIDSAYYGNFMRYVNHQDAPTVEATPIYVPTWLLVKLNRISKKLAKELPDFIETMVFTTIEDIYPGQELFVDYGQNYWADKENMKVRQLTQESMSRHLDLLQVEVSEMKSENEKLSSHIKVIKDTLRELFGEEVDQFLGSD